jgi:hypothetical protein
VLKLMEKHFIDPKRSEILSVFPCTTQIALFWPNLLPALFLKSLDNPALLKSLWINPVEKCTQYFLRCYVNRKSDFMTVFWSLRSQRCLIIKQVPCFRNSCFCWSFCKKSCLMDMEDRGKMIHWLSIKSPD